MFIGHFAVGLGFEACCTARFSRRIECRVKNILNVCNFEQTTNTEQCYFCLIFVRISRSEGATREDINYATRFLQFR